MKDDFGCSRRGKLTPGVNNGFAFGFRLWNWVLLDIRINYNGNADWKVNFPGRIWLWKSEHFRFALPYFVWPGGRHKDSRYRGSLRHLHIIGGGYEKFFECTDYHLPSHYGKRRTTK